MRRWGAGLATLLVAGAVAGGVVISGSGSEVTCHQTATNAATLATAVTAASTGQNVCLTADVSYGTWNGTNKAITLIAQSGSGSVDPTSPTLTIDFGSGDTGFTIDGGMSTWGAGIDSGEGMMLLSNGIDNGATNITLKNFRSSRAGTDLNRTWLFDPAPASPSNITIDHAAFYNEGDVANNEATFYIWCASACNTGITIKNSLCYHSTTDCFKLSNNAAVNVINNKILDSHECLPTCRGNHTDVVQFNNGANSVIRGNWIQDADQCISGFDEGTAGNTITHNVMVDCGPHWVTLMDDHPASTVAWNTFGTGSGPGTSADGGTNSIICSTSTSTAPSGSASLTNIFNNVGMKAIDTTFYEIDCTPTRNDHNVTAEPVFVGGSWAASDTFDEFSDFCLDPSSPGYTGADDGGQVGVCGGDYDPATYGPPSGEGY